MHKSNPLLKSIAGLAILAFFLQSCGSIPNAPSFFPTEKSSHNVNFHLQLPTPIFSGHTVVLEILDPFDTDGAYSAFFPMNSTDGIHYQVEATIPYSSEFRYRYILQGSEKTPESAPNAPKGASRFATSLTVEVNDVLTRWVNQNNSTQTGVLSGKVTNQSGQPIAGALIAAGGAIAITDATGDYLLAGLAEGKHTLTAFGTENEYLSFSQEAIISAGMETQADFSLKSPEFSDVELHLTIPEQSQFEQSPRLYINDLTKKTIEPVDPTGGPTQLDSGKTEYRFVTRQPIGQPFLYRYSFGNQFVNTEVPLDGQPNTRTFIPTNPSEVVTSEFDLGSDQQKAIELEIHLAEGVATPTSMSVLLGEGSFGSPIPMQNQQDGAWRILIRQPIEWKNTYPIKICRLTICNHNNLDLSAVADVSSIDFSSQQNTLLSINVASWKNFKGWSDLAIEEVVATPKPDNFRYGFSVSHNADLAQRETWDNLQNSVDLSKANTVIFEHAYLVEPTLLELVQPLRGLDEKTIQNDLGQTHKWLRIKIDGGEIRSSSAVGANDQQTVDALLLERATQILIAEATNAQAAEAEAIVLDLSRLQPIVPSYETADQVGNVVQLEAWSNILGELRSVFRGQIFGVVNLTEDGISGLPGFATELDGFMVNWRTPLGNPSELDGDGLANSAFDAIQNDIIPNIPTGKTIYLDLGIPSVIGVLEGCFAPAEPCSQGTDIDEQAQASFYRAVLNAVEWSGNIEGIFSAGFDPTIAVTDTSDSVYQKPAQGVIQTWYPGWSGK